MNFDLVNHPKMFRRQPGAHSVKTAEINPCIIRHSLLAILFLPLKKGLLLLLSHFSRVQLCATPQTEAHQIPRPWDSPGKNTGVGCHFLLQCMKVKGWQKPKYSTQSSRKSHSFPIVSLYLVAGLAVGRVFVPQRYRISFSSSLKLLNSQCKWLQILHWGLSYK